MRPVLAVSAALVTLAIGYAAGNVRSAVALDEHADHDMRVSAVAGPRTPAADSIPASGAAAAERLAKSPRHAEWVATKVGATDSVMAWVVYPERRDKAPVVIAIHENTDQLAADDFIGIAPDLTTMFRTGDLKADPTQEATDSTMKQLGKSYEYHIFDGAGHGFLRGQDNSPANAAASVQAWPKTIAFLRAKLGR